jgi:hypothetical protein
MDTNGREFKGGLNSCRFAFIRGCKPSSAGWINHEWTLMDAKFKEDSFVSIRVYSWLQAKLSRLD